MSHYSGPANPKEADACTITPYFTPHHETKIGWMGTGDAPLKDMPDIVAFEHFYSNDITRVASFMFPHHGSIENSDHTRLVSDADIYIAAADPRHDWEHPSNLLCQAAYRAGKDVEIVREQRCTAFDECVLVAWGTSADQLCCHLLQATCTAYMEPDKGLLLKLKGPRASRQFSAVSAASSKPR